jgi:DNA-binding NarL/FixJ family response regulator
MYSSVVTVLLLLSLLFFLVCKRRMLSRVFSLDFAEQVKEFEKKIETTANGAVDKIAGASGDLAQLLAQAEEIIDELKVRNKIAEEKLYKIAMNELKKSAAVSERAETRMAGQPSFAEQLIKANYKTALHLDEEPDVSQRAYKLSGKAAAAPGGAARQQHDVLAQEPEEADEQSNVREFPQNSSPDFDMAGAEPKFRRKQILRLAASGYDDIDIARALRLGIGEVRLTRKLGAK